MKKKLVALLLTGVMSLSLMTGCGNASTNASSKDKTYKIGVLQLLQHAALDASNEGFIAALNDYKKGVTGAGYGVGGFNKFVQGSASTTAVIKLFNEFN